MEENATQLRSRLVESVFACVAVLVLCVVVLAATGRSAVPGAFLAVVGLGALALLGAWVPRIALGLTILGIFAYYAAGFPPLGMVLPAVGALYLAASRGRTVWAVGCAVILLSVATYFRLTGADPVARIAGYEYVTEIALAAASIALGAAVRASREQRRQAMRIAELVVTEQKHAAERQVQLERMRIARELHDSLGHQLTVAALHASVAAEALGETPGAGERAAREALERVREANTGTLRELRSAVRLLRSDGTEQETPGVGPRDPDPLGIVALARTAREAGLTVEAHAEPLDVDPAVAEAANRILTEAVTNVLRHAEASHLRIEACDDDGSLRLAVTDDGRGASDRLLERGHGIAGMRERAALADGTLTVASVPGRGCAVRAELPIRVEER